MAPKSPKKSKTPSAGRGNIVSPADEHPDRRGIGVGFSPLLPSETITPPSSQDGRRPRGSSSTTTTAAATVSTVSAPLLYRQFSNNVQSPSPFGTEQGVRFAHATQPSPSVVDQFASIRNELRDMKENWAASVRNDLRALVGELVRLPQLTFRSVELSRPN